jgi:CBS domain-containing protein
MHPGVTACPADAPLSTVVRAMADHRVHCVAVAGVESPSGPSPHLIWGLIEDIAVVAALHRQALGEPAATIAERSPVAVAESETLERVARLMVEHDTRHVVAVGARGLPSGMVSSLDVASVLAAGG